jgi:uncharacterized membrane protein
MAGDEENRILRVWTPILLRTILIAAMIVLIVGLVLTYTYAPDYYVHRYNEVRQGHLIGQEKIATLIDRIREGNPHAILTIGLFVLTLVPLVRVGFSFVLFVAQRDYTFVLFTGYVLAGLIIGVLIGSAG